MIQMIQYFDDLHIFFKMGDETTTTKNMLCFFCGFGSFNSQNHPLIDAKLAQKNLSGQVFLFNDPGCKRRSWSLL